jgi:hypothetical protein
MFFHYPHTETTSECPCEKKKKKKRQQMFLQKGLHTIILPANTANITEAVITLTDQFSICFLLYYGICSPDLN